MPSTFLEVFYFGMAGLGPTNKLAQAAACASSLFVLVLWIHGRDRKPVRINTTG